jgi:L-amino acid N-acyltransferase
VSRQEDSLHFVTCTYDAHASAILEILNEAIANSTALYDYKPRAPENIAGWFKTKEAGRFPVIGAIGDAGQLLGFASYGTFRAWPAHKYSVSE